MSEMIYKVANLLPHAVPMVLLDKIVHYEEAIIVTSLTVRAGIPFFTPEKGIASYVGLEYMAQTCGVYAGLEGLKRGQPVRLGFLLGTRNYQTITGWFGSGDHLTIEAQEIYREDTMGVFQCRIKRDDVELASAQLNLYRPDNIATILEQRMKD